MSLSKDAQLIAYRELDDGYRHAEKLHVFIREVLYSSQVAMVDLSAIAVSKGPGSYTGLRIGVSAAKGLAYALSIPLISIDTLQLMCQHSALPSGRDIFYCPMMDARRMEVYTCIYDSKFKALEPIAALIINEESILQFQKYSQLKFFGNGMNKCLPIIETLQNVQIIEAVIPSAQYMCSLSYKKYAAKQFEDLAYFEPFYLKDFLIHKKI